jgi:hypothetical protein
MPFSLLKPFINLFNEKSIWEYIAHIKKEKQE